MSASRPRARLDFDLDVAAETRRARDYYDRFAATYEAHRDGRGRYHDLIDDLEVELAIPYARRADVLEVGCGTGLISRRLAAHARSIVGVDLSPAMLAVARSRGLDVVEGSALALPFDDARFDLAVAFKTLPHVPDLAGALSELARVVRPGGVAIAEVYGPMALRAAWKRWLPPARVGDGTERDVFVRFDDRAAIERALPSTLTIERVRGARSVVPFARALEVPLLGAALARCERALCDGAFAARFGGFVAYVLRRA